MSAWIANQPDPKPSRPEAICEAVTEHLKAKGYLGGTATGTLSNEPHLPTAASLDGSEKS